MAAIDDVARDFTAMLRLGQFEAAGEAFWSLDVTSVEPEALSDETPAAVSGRAAARAKRRARFGTAQIDDLIIDGPFVTGDQFALLIDMLVTEPASRQAEPFTGIAVFTVREGCIVHERFFYA